MQQIQEFTIAGRIPSKKNSRNVFVRGGKPVNIPSKKYNQWHQSAATQIRGHGRKIRLKSVEDVQMDFYFPDFRKCDLTNKAESVMDLLVDCKIIEDDNWMSVPRIILSSKGVDKENPRVKIWIRHNNKGVQCQHTKNSERTTSS